MRKGLLVVGIKTPEFTAYDLDEMRRDPYPTYEVLRSLGPVVYVPEIDRYLVTTFDAVSEGERSPEVFSSHAPESNTMIKALGKRPMLRKDDPEHAEERVPINPSLRPKAIMQVWKEKFTKNTREIIGQISLNAGDSFDLNSTFSAPLASKNLIDIIGLQDMSIEEMTWASTSYIAGIGNLHQDQDIWEQCEAAQKMVESYLDELIPFYQQNPDTSLISALSNSGLAEERVRANIHLAISGGMNEPQHLITSMVWALLTHSHARDAVLRNEVSWGDVFDEIARWQSPIGMVPRTCTKDVEFQGVSLPAGANVGFLVASANRDDSKFDKAEIFDVNRPKAPNLAFGAGPHLCAGKWAAKAAISEVAVPELLRAFPDLELASEPIWDGWVFRGIEKLDVRY